VPLEGLHHGGPGDEELLGALVLLHDVLEPVVDGHDVVGLDVVLQHDGQGRALPVPRDVGAVVHIPRHGSLAESIELPWGQGNRAAFYHGLHLEAAVDTLDVLHIEDARDLLDAPDPLGFFHDGLDLAHGRGVVDVFVHHAHEDVRIGREPFLVGRILLLNRVVLAKDDFNPGIDLDPGDLRPEGQGERNHQTHDPDGAMDAEAYEPVHRIPPRAMPCKPSRNDFISPYPHAFTNQSINTLQSICILNNETSLPLLSQKNRFPSRCLYCSFFYRTQGYSTKV